MAKNLEGMIRDDYGWFLGKFNDVKPELKPAAVARALMIRRTRRRGIDRHEQKFTPYAESTRRRKIRKGQPSGYVTLTDSGRMLDDLIVETPGGSGGGFTVRGGRTRRIARVKPGNPRSRRLLRFHVQGRGRLPVRDFFGLTGREQLIVEAEFRGEIERIVPPKGSQRHVVNVITRLG